MWKTAVRSLIAHKLRLVLTLLAITLGVSFVVGTFVFTDSLNRSLEQIFENEPADIVVSPKDDVTARPQGGGGGTVRSLTMPESVVRNVQDVKGVSKAIGSVNQIGAVVLDENDESIAAPTSTPIGVSWEPDQDSGQATIVTGSAPEGDAQVALDTSTASKAGAEVGSKIRISTPLKTDASKEWEVTAIVEVGLSGGVTLVLFDLPTAQEHLVGEGKITDVLVTVDEGETPGKVAVTINEAISDRYEAITGRQAADDQMSQISDSLGFLNTFLLVFALIAVFVSAFLIFNTFSMLVAQRTRELALLRAIGASREQVQASVILEATLLGVVASTLGVIVGIGLALGLRSVFGLTGIDLPAGSLAITARTLLVAYIVGITVTVVAAYLPARRASRVPPVAAMRAEVTSTRASMLKRTISGVCSWALSGLMVLVGLSNGTNTGIAIIGLAAFLGIIGTIALSPYLARPFVKVLGMPFRSTTGRLAVLNTQRDARRTAATASALTIGVTLMSAMVIFASSFTATASDSIDEAYGADFTLGSPPQYEPFDHKLYDQVTDIEGVGSSTYLKSTSGQRNQGGGLGLTAVLVFGLEPDRISEMINFDVVDGSLLDLRDGEVAVDSRTAKNFHWELGQDATVEFRTGKRAMKIAAIYEPILVFTGLLTTIKTAEELGAPADLDSTVYLKLDEGADADAVRDRVNSVLNSYPTISAQDQAQIKADVEAQINQLLGLVFALLALAVLIAVLGIANTLLLSVAERTKELGLLRAVGVLPGQIRGMITIESLLLGLFGALLGVGLGLLYGVLLQRAMEVEGLTSLSIPWPWLVVFVFAGAISGVAASVWPAVTASRLNILAAIATE